jgi:hypothetical protein
MPAGKREALPGGIWAMVAVATKSAQRINPWSLIFMARVRGG